MTADAFLQALGVAGGADFDPVEKRFLELVKERIQSVSESYDEAGVEKESRVLREFHEQFFRYALQWASSQKSDKKDHPDAAKLKAAARQAVTGLQANIIEFALCYMHINRLQTLLRDEIKREEIRLGVPARNVKWTGDMGILISRHKKQQQEILAGWSRMREARPLLEKIEKDIIGLRAATATLFGRDKAEPLVRHITAGLRVADFRRARKALRDLLEEKGKFSLDAKAMEAARRSIDETGKSLIEEVSGAAKLLEGADNKLYLRVIETDMAYNMQVRELRKIRAFMGKYHLPYMQYKLDMLSHGKDKLLVIGSLESLLTLYKRLIGGLAGSLSDIKDVRIYESEVLEKIRYLMDGHFQEIPKILERARETVAEFRASNKEFAEMEQMELEEVSVADDKAAEASG